MNNLLVVFIIAILVAFIAKPTSDDDLEAHVVEVCGPEGSGLLEVDGRVYSCRQAEAVRGVEAARNVYLRNCERVKAEWMKDE